MEKKVNIEEIIPNPENPRNISKKKFDLLLKSIKEFPDMLETRPLVVDENMVVLGGNMRLKALKRLGVKKVLVKIKDKWNDKQKKEFTIKDNVAFGDWDWDVLANEWDVKQLEDWAVNVPTVKNTELLSGLEYNPMYYEPKENPLINLEDCIDLTKYNDKVKALNEYDLTDEQKKILKLFAYRFIKIDFESVANYYYFNATDEEQKAIERLRLVLTDNGLNGFIEDDLIRILNLTNEFNND